MATKIRLQRHGKKGKAFFHIVAADSRAKRDGKFIEKLGVYNPVSNPATIDIDFERTLHWVTVGAEMTDTARAILSYKGVLYKNHLVKGVNKGALTMEEADRKFDLWLLEKQNKIQAKIDGLSKATVNDKSKRLQAEMEINASKALALEAKLNPPVEEVEETTVDSENEDGTVSAASDSTEASGSTEETSEA